jgi:hypothetical protein
MRARTTLVLSVVALALLAFIVFFERGMLSTGEREGRKGRVLDSFVRGKVERLELQRRGVTTVLTRVPVDDADPFAGGGWKVEQPYAARADQNTVDSVLGALEWIDARRSLGELSESEREKFGLNKPRFRVTYLVGRERVSLSVGGPAADGGGFYLGIAGQPRAYVVGKDLIEALDHAPEDFHTRELHEGVSLLTMTHLRLRGAAGVRSLERRDNLNYLKEPFESLASEPALRGVTDALDALRATRYVIEKPSDLAGYGLAEPRLTLELESKVFDTKVKNKTIQEKLTLRIGGPCTEHAGESFVRVGEGAVYCVSDAELSKLDKRAEDLRELRLLPLDDAEIQGVEIKAGDRELKLSPAAKGGEQQRYVSSEGGREKGSGVADPGALSEWYKALRNVTLARVEPARASALREPAELQLTFQRGKDHAPFVLKLSAAGSELQATRSQDPSLLFVAGSARELLTPSAARFRKPRVLDENEATFRKLVLTRADGLSETVTKQDGIYRLTSSAAYSGKAERGTVDEILRLASKLDALRFVADSAAPEHGLAKPYRTLRVEYSGDKGAVTSHTLEIGAESGAPDQSAGEVTAKDGRFARLDADPAVFVITNALLQKLDAPLVSRDALGAPLDELAALDLGGRVKLERRNGTWAVAGAEGQSARAERLARALAGLQASRAVSYGMPDAAHGLDKPQLRVTARLAEGRTVTWLFGAAVPGAADNAQVFARRSDLDITFQVARSALDALLERSGAG